MPDNDGIVIAGSNSAAEFFAVLCFKIFSCRHQHISGWIELQKLRRPLFGQMVGDDKEGFAA